MFSQVVKTLQGRRDEDQVAIAKQAQRTKAEIATLNDNVSALQAVNADMKGNNDSQLKHKDQDSTQTSSHPSSEVLHTSLI